MTTLDDLARAADAAIRAAAERDDPATLAARNAAVNAYAAAWRMSGRPTARDVERLRGTP